MSNPPLSETSQEYVKHMKNYHPEAAQVTNKHTETEKSEESSEEEDIDMEISEFEYNLKTGDVSKLKQKMNAALKDKLKKAKQKARDKGYAKKPDKL